MTDNYPNDTQTTNLVEQAQALGKVSDSLATTLGHLMALYVEPQTNLKAAHTALLEAGYQLAEASKAMRHTQQNRASARQRAEAEAQAEGKCNHSLTILTRTDGQIIVRCYKCQQRAEFSTAELFEHGVGIEAAFRQAVAAAFGINAADMPLI